MLVSIYFASKYSEYASLSKSFQLVRRQSIRSVEGAFMSKVEGVFHATANPAIVTVAFEFAASLSLDSGKGSYHLVLLVAHAQKGHDLQDRYRPSRPNRSTYSTLAGRFSFGPRSRSGACFPTVLFASRSAFWPCLPSKPPFSPTLMCTPIRYRSRSQIHCTVLYVPGLVL